MKVDCSGSWRACYCCCSSFLLFETLSTRLYFWKAFYVAWVNTEFLHFFWIFLLPPAGLVKQGGVNFRALSLPFELELSLLKVILCNCSLRLPPPHCQTVCSSCMTPVLQQLICMLLKLQLWILPTADCIVSCCFDLLWVLNGGGIASECNLSFGFSRCEAAAESGRGQKTGEVQWVRLPSHRLDKYCADTSNTESRWTTTLVITLWLSWKAMPIIQRDPDLCNF